jgi:hypothetical protein
VSICYGSEAATTTSCKAIARLPQHNKTSSFLTVSLLGTHHSTAAAVVKVLPDILLALDTRDLIMLTLLDSFATLL